MYTAIKASFRAYVKYDTLKSLLDKIGLPNELARERVSSEYVTGTNPKLVFTLMSGEKRAVFPRIEDEDENRYALIFPDKQSLYNKIYALLKSRNLKVSAELVDFEALSLPHEDQQLLRRY